MPSHLIHDMKLSDVFYISPPVDAAYHNIIVLLH